ncbi:lec-4, partial [Pristionchus pacificus]
TFIHPFVVVSSSRRLLLIQIMMQQNISLPYTSKLGAPFIAGQSLNITGTTNNDTKRFEVNLLAGGTEIGAAQAYMHCSVRFDEGKLVFNSYTDGTWAKEERQSLPFHKGDTFNLRMRVLEEGYEVRCNGEKVHVFKHRKPYGEVEYFQVKGECTLTNVHWGGKFYEIPWETGFANGSLKSGQRIFMYGAPTGDRFNVDLIARNGDILFHFNPRMPEGKVVRNSWKNKVWGSEEREGPFPFKKDCGFDLTIVNEPFSIQLIVNGEQIGTWAHRTENPAEDYIGMRVQGNVDVFGIEFSETQ